jgi:hypothetical protein
MTDGEHYYTMLSSYRTALANLLHNVLRRFHYLGLTHASFENPDRCRKPSPNFKINTGIIARHRLNAPRQVNPHPYPRRSTSGAVPSGKKVPNKHRVTIMPVIADAENRPKASTTYAWRGTIVRSKVNPRNATDARRSHTGSLSSAIHPNIEMDSGRATPPQIVSGRRYSGLPLASGSDPRSLTYILSRPKLHTTMLRKEPTPGEEVSD